MLVCLSPRSSKGETGGGREGWDYSLNITIQAQKRAGHRSLCRAPNAGEQGRAHGVTERAAGQTPLPWGPLLGACCSPRLQRAPGQPLAAKSVPPSWTHLLPALCLGASLGSSWATWLVRGRNPPGFRKGRGTRWSPTQQHGADVGERRARWQARLRAHVHPAHGLLWPLPRLSGADEGATGPRGSAGLRTTPWGSPGAASLRAGSACSFPHQLLGKTVGNGDTTG